MLNWIKCSDRMPSDENTLNNHCLVKTVSGAYMFALWSVHSCIWRRIEVPFKFSFDKVIDELIDKDDVEYWVPFNEIKKTDD